MILYRYDPTTYQFIGQEEALKNIVSSAIRQKDVYIIPQNTTPIAPMFVNGFVPVWNKKNNIWENKKNNIGKKYYDIENKRVDTIKDFDNTKIPLTEDDEYQISLGKTVFVKDGKYIIEFTKEQKEDNVRTMRNILLKNTDVKVSASDFPIDEETKGKYFEYRKYLRDYTQIDKWYESNPLSFEDWCKKDFTIKF